MTTPEGKVKAKIRALLDHPKVWAFWPVPMGYQAATLDVLCVVRVRNIPVFFMIEAKRRKGPVKARQDYFKQDLYERLNVKTFVIDGEQGLQELEQWLTRALAL